ncbi:MAG: bZIP transcription factor [Terriglobus roseus]|nr:bZIP transcription factor [Terriglobus roseus]
MMDCTAKRYSDVGLDGNAVSKQRGIYRPNTGDRKRKNAQAQSDFRRRKKDYVEQLETSIEEAGRHLEHVVRSCPAHLFTAELDPAIAQTALHRKATEEVAELRRSNARLEELAVRLRGELDGALAQLNVASPSVLETSPTLAPVEPRHEQIGNTPIETDMSPVQLSILDASTLSYFADDLNLYDAMDAPTMPCAPAYAAMQSLLPFDARDVDAVTLPALAFSPLSAASEALPRCAHLSALPLQMTMSDVQYASDERSP